LVERGFTVLPSDEIPGHNQFMAKVQSELGNDGYTAARARRAAMTQEQITPFALGEAGQHCW
jgi:hypothetical protein